MSTSTVVDFERKQLQKTNEELEARLATERAELATVKRAFESQSKDYTRVNAELLSVRTAAEKRIAQADVTIAGMDRKLAKCEALIVRLLREQGKTDEEIITLTQGAGLFSLRLVDDKHDAFGKKKA